MTLIRTLSLFLALSLLPLAQVWAQSHSDVTVSEEEIEERVRSAPRGNAANNIAHFSPDGSRITTMTPGGTFAIRDLETKDILQSFPGQSRYTYEATWSPDGSMLASSSVDGTVHLWDVDSGQRVAVLDQFSNGSPTMGGGITEARFSPDGRYLAVLQRYTPGRVAVWDMQEEAEVMRVERSGKVYGMAWGEEGQQIYTAEEDGAMYSWSFPAGKEVDRWKVQDDYLFDIDVAGSRIVVGGRSGVLHVLNIDDGRIIQRLRQGSFVNRAAIVPNSPFVAGVSSDGMLKVWNSDTGALHFQRFAHNANAYSVTVSPDHRTLATVGQDRYVRLWDVETGALLGTIGGTETR
ncbi:WD40 repeat domain-containing protein [Longibacter salinarum]|nr:WD40 repeat domain-containing protein [Longibacter salinarum]